MSANLKKRKEREEQDKGKEEKTEDTNEDTIIDEDSKTEEEDSMPPPKKKRKHKKHKKQKICEILGIKIMRLHHYAAILPREKMVSIIILSLIYIFKNHQMGWILHFNLPNVPKTESCILCTNNSESEMMVYDGYILYKTKKYFSLPKLLKDVRFDTHIHTHHHIN